MSLELFQIGIMNCPSLDIKRVHEVGRMSDHTYINGEHRWESNMTSM